MSFPDTRKKTVIKNINLLVQLYLFPKVHVRLLPYKNYKYIYQKPNNTTFLCPKVQFSRHKGRTKVFDRMQKLERQGVHRGRLFSPNYHFDWRSYYRSQRQK